MPPFATDPPWPVYNPAIDDNATSASRAENDTKDRSDADSVSVAGF